MARVSWIAGRLRVFCSAEGGSQPSDSIRRPGRGRRPSGPQPAQEGAGGWPDSRPRPRLRPGRGGEAAQLRFWAKSGCGPNEQYKKRFFFYFQKPFEYEFFDEFH